MWILIIIFLFLSGVSKAFMDTSSEDRFESFSFLKIKFSKKWLNKSTGWKFKWKLGEKANGEAFPLSSTALVFLTDGWHLFQFFFLTFIELAIAFSTYNTQHYFEFLWDKEDILLNIATAYVVCKILISGVFQLFYSLLEVKFPKNK